MTNLDAKALEAAEAEFSECCSMPMQLAIKRTVTAYLDALPPAVSAWGVSVGGKLRPKAYKTREAAHNRSLPAHGHQAVPVEIREVRQS